MNLYLIGYRCTGKTSVSERLGAKLKWPVLDADAELTREQGRTIQEIVDSQGWETFRRMEAQVLCGLSTKDRHIIATGGGVVLNPDNIDIMQRSGEIKK